MLTMGDVARRSIQDEDGLYRLFGVNAELLIDHAWGWEPCTIAAVKAYRPESNSVGSGQVLQSPYPAGKARLVVHEMADALALDLVGKGMVTNQVVLTVGSHRPGAKEAVQGPGYRRPLWAVCAQARPRDGASFAVQLLGQGDGPGGAGAV